MKSSIFTLTLLSGCFLAVTFVTQGFAQDKETFSWPEGIKAAVTLSFDDARLSQVDVGTPLLDQFGVKATFVVVPSAVEKRLDQWKAAAVNGHEIGNHTIKHPCSGNFTWSRNKALEDYTLASMKAELIETNWQIRELVGTEPRVFAYPCGSTFVGRGIYTESYVPIIAELFLAGRGWLDEAPNDPFYCDFPQLTGMQMDAKDFDEILPLLKNAQSTGAWLVLAGHEIGSEGAQTTRVEMLKQLIKYAQDPANGIWIGTLGEIAEYVQGQRKKYNVQTVVRPETNGDLHLPARFARGIGPRIEYMPEWEAFGWFTGKDRVEWIVNTETGGNYDVFLEWSVDDQEAGKSFILSSGKSKIKGKVSKSGSWETYQTKKIGQISLESGLQKLTFAPRKDFGEGALLDLKSIELRKVK